MITVKLLGGARKALLADKLEINKEEMTIAGLLEYLQRLIPSNNPILDIENILVAVNGIDSSALGGNDTRIKDGDVINIIPIIHGGSKKRINFKCGNTFVELIRLGKISKDPTKFLEELRKQYPDLLIQGVWSKYIISKKHAKKVISISLSARKASVLLSNRVETDVLMRFAFTRQINNAINKIGLKKGKDSTLIIIGKKSSVNKFFQESKYIMSPVEFLSDNSNFMKKECLITKKQLASILSKKPLEDLLSERSAVLFH